MKSVLDVHASLDPKPIETLTPAEARRQPTLADAVIQKRQDAGDLRAEPKPDVAKVETKTIPGGGGTPIPVRVYTPEGDEPFPLVVYFHGGGWVIGSLDAYDSSCRALADKTRAVVVSVDYRQAPEHKFPAAHEDGYAALQHVMLHAADFGGDPTRVAVAGESAGGNIATATCLMAKQRGGRMPVHQLLVYPVTDYGFETESYREHANAKPLNRAMMPWFFGHYLASPSDGATTMVSPLRASSEELRGLPPATVIVAGIDPLHSEGVAYASKLEKSGVGVDLRDFPRATHEFFGLTSVVREADEAQDFAARNLAKAFESKRGPDAPAR